MQPENIATSEQGVPAVLEHAGRPDGMDSAGNCYRGRVAPSPTGLLHVGHARTFWAAAQRAEAARMQGCAATLVMRVDDMDGARSKAEFIEAGYEDLRWLGVSWQEGPDVGGQFAPYVQSQRMDSYRAALEVLKSKGLVYPCCCSRKDIAAALSAPHQGEEEPVYPGTCRPCSNPAAQASLQSSMHLDRHATSTHMLAEEAERHAASSQPVGLQAGNDGKDTMAGGGMIGSTQPVLECNEEQLQRRIWQDAAAGTTSNQMVQQAAALPNRDCCQTAGTQQNLADGSNCHDAVLFEPAKAQPEPQPAIPATEAVTNPTAPAQGQPSESESHAAFMVETPAVPSESTDTGGVGASTDAAQPPTHDQAWHASHSMTANAGPVADHSKSVPSSQARQQLKAARRAEREAKQAQAREARLAKHRQQASTRNSFDGAGAPTGRRRPSGAPQTTSRWSWRFRVPDNGTIIRFTDNCLGVQEFVVGKDFGDFVVWRHDDLPGYQLACVVDDAMMQITEVVRGADLLVSTARQLLLAWALGYENIPAYYHCPLVCDADNKRLAKRSDAMSIRALRAAGKQPEQVLMGNVVDLVARPSKQHGQDGPCMHSP